MFNFSNYILTLEGDLDKSLENY